MIDVPNFYPHEEGPLFPEDAGKMIEDTETFLRASDQNVRDAVESENIKDISDSSFKAWAKKLLAENGITSADDSTY